ncbi:hypothetical protein DLM45_16255 [Hyphomicrobium methylovorum]|uniref:hypothetical protein n=1 Tax=Hyphomicrobium methylovorum TaxID=84 RepID=UPI0015E79414|nr:hypothetical protein [Hyphomicrobium methylovorum]MBA2127765.1 hypothetical protein [Hyphomicrobium methylovorum]
MALVTAHRTLMLPEALVIESLLEAHGIAVATASKDIVFQCPQLTTLFGGIEIRVAESDLAAARALIADVVEEVPGYETLESRAFRRRPIRNALLTFAMLLIGAPFPFWYRNEGLRGLGSGE